MLRWGIANAAVLLGSALTASTALGQLVTLADIEARAQRPRPELSEKEASIDRAQAELLMVQTKSGPTLGARIEAGVAPGGRLVTVEEADHPENRYLVQGSRPFGQADALLPQPRYAAVLSGKITLLDFGRTKLGVRAAEAAVGAERASLVSAKVELVNKARSAYLLWIEAHQTWQLAERDAEVARARSASVRGLITEGARPATDLTLTSYDEQLAQLRQTRARRAAQAALRGLSVVIQSELPPEAVPDLEVLESALPASRSSATASPPAVTGAKPEAASLAASPQNPTLSALELKHQAALSAASAADRAGVPVLDATADLGVQGQEADVFPVYRAALVLSVPIYDGGQRAAQAAAHRAEAREIEAHLHGLERALGEQQNAARDRFEAASNELKLTLDLLTTAEALLSEAEDHYRSGSDTLDRLLSAQRSLVQARREVLTAKLDSARARLDLTPVHVEP